MRSAGERGDLNTPFELFHIECENGWASLYEPLIARCKAENVSILQIKEKWGGLRFYVGPASKDLCDAIDEAEKRSFTICEECGEQGKVRSGGWVRTLCDEHAKE